VTLTMIWIWMTFGHLPRYLEPVGPELKVEHHTLAVIMAFDLVEEDCSICRDLLDVAQWSRSEVPVKVGCGRVFHCGCLNTLINGISTISNSCPNCRQEICERRVRHLEDHNNLMPDIATRHISHKRWKLSASSKIMRVM
jgi:hypothetical protein